MTQDEIITSLLEKYDDCEYKDSDIFKISYLTSYLNGLVNRKELFDFLVKIEEDKLLIYLKKRKVSHIHTFEIKSYFREQRLKKLLNKKNEMKDYTIEQLESDLENSKDSNDRYEKLERLLSSDYPQLMEDSPSLNIIIEKYKDDLSYLRDKYEQEESDKCNSDINKGLESGEIELYTCIKEPSDILNPHTTKYKAKCEVGDNYYLDHTTNYTWIYLVNIRGLKFRERLSNNENVLEYFNKL